MQNEKKESLVHAIIYRWDFFWGVDYFFEISVAVFRLVKKRKIWHVIISLIIFTSVFKKLCVRVKGEESHLPSDFHGESHTLQRLRCYRHWLHCRPQLHHRVTYFAFALLQAERDNFFVYFRTFINTFDLFWTDLTSLEQRCLAMLN